VISGQSAAADYVAIFQRIEDVETFSGKTVTLSFDAYAATGTPKIGVEWEQFFGTGGSTAVRAAVSAIPIGTSRNRYSITFTFPPISGKTVVAGSYLRAIFWLSAGADNASKASSIGIQNNTFYITDVQLEAGAAASPFERLPVQQQLAWCQRYFQRWNTPSLRGVMTSATLAARLGMVLPVQMRTLPSASISGSIYVYDGAATATISSLGTAYWDTKAGAIEFNSTIGSSLTVGRPAITLLDNTSSAYLDLSAEL
jgi:hypothetical protein